MTNKNLMDTKMPKANKSIILTSGGTGGHIFPALAVAEALKVLAPQTRIIFVGGSHGPEAKLVVNAGIEFVALPVKGVLGRGFSGLKALLGLFSESISFRAQLKEFNPAVVAGFGGYASVPAILAACLVGVPTLIHEQNSLPGLSNRFMSKFAKRICLSIHEAQAFFNAKKCVLTGNPVRASISDLAALDRSNPMRHLLVIGGSQGAKALNSAIIKALPKLLALNIEITHQCGAADFETMQQASAELSLGLDPTLNSEAEEAKIQPQYHVFKFIDNMAAAYTQADVVLSRAGATSIAELCAAALPSVLVPFPYATHDHQTHNAKALEKSGAAICLKQADLNADDFDFAAFIDNLLNDPVRLTKMSESARNLAKLDAAESVAKEILKLAELSE